LVDGKRLDDVVGAGFAVITSASLNPSQRDEMANRGTVVVTAHPGTELDLWLRAGRATAAVVRPDRTVLCASRNLAEVCNAVPVFASPADAGADA
jgi:3-(3-hydroxy-phenyl)propionate hydroxylase